ncbi:hypothetical protein DUI87_06027 [Hirundo rustica rustica]|uniref:glutathione transferase n=1 Tax=Hirundo rustica rustica TaxID=333673 RepID=A0A3M0KWA7_HIRRU|nr:hypothetical protein DUI87_06027 [Hirundo rustica rustica]
MRSRNSEEEELKNTVDNQPYAALSMPLTSENGNQELKNMSGKPRLTYLNGRGRMESIRWLLAAAGVEFEEVYLETKEQYDKLIKDGFLLFQQVPLVEIDGMKMVQTRAIMSYIAGKYNLHGKDLKERAMIDMYVEGISDLMQMILMFPFSPPDAKEKNLESIKEKATNRYFPVFEKVLKQHGQDFLVGNKFSWADVQLMEAILAVEEKVPAVLSGFPQLQFEESYLEKNEDLIKLRNDGSLLFQQVPMVEMDGMKLVQTRAIANYIATKYNLYGKDLKERVLIDMYVEGMFDLNELLMKHGYLPAHERKQDFANMIDKTENRYFPVFEKVLKDHGKDFLVGNQLSRADVQLLEIILMAEEWKPDILAKFPLLQFEESYLEKKEDLIKLQKDGSLLFQQVPMVEMDGMKLVQTRAIANYIATKYNLYGKDLKERVLNSTSRQKEQHFANMMDKTENRYFPVFEKVLKDHGKDFLVGNQLSRADVQLLEIILMVEEWKPEIFSKFPLLQSFKARICKIPTIKKFLQPGSQRKPPTDEIVLDQSEESYLEKKEDLIKLQKDGSLLFQQVPMVEMDGMKLVQTRAIANYIATKYNLYGKDLKERVLIDMYVEGMFDLTELFVMYEIQPADKREQYVANMMDKTENRYFPVFEKVLKDHGKDFLVGNQLSRADVQLLEIILMAEEWKPDILARFPLLQSFKARICKIPTIKKFLQPGSQRKPPTDDAVIDKVMKIFFYGTGFGLLQALQGNKNSEIMAGKPKLHYTKGRGKMESIRWLLAAAGVEDQHNEKSMESNVERWTDCQTSFHFSTAFGVTVLFSIVAFQFEEEFIETKEDLEKLRNDGVLLFQQVPMVEIDGMRMVQTRAILSYIAAKYNLYGKDLKERAWIDMYVEGTTDLMGMIMYLPFQPADTKEKNLALMIERATTRYFPVYEKALKGQDYLVGNKLSWADVHLLEAILMVEECKADVLSAFPLLQAFKGRISNIPTIKKFLQPGSQRKPPTDEKFVAVVRKIFNI